ncbi:cystine-binding periplasmic protein precursor [Variibacter gotjawalensis]|uniref:Cystine-binding periplasmic protein n=1 Tax=Variibacter gotjawalensis TaxID=1333996 RepID=A0A0S3PP10_9BRAD|nr:transporter substrate-binding domain-containing protein [Variibacter gotjawalensis]NIK47968.1 polar amino acid transport system substrate-binding protein [Variibacter gotjawalensis]RZS49845.1 amino acid ABC transporter substrate-binding protein (PAAT family) [Variibacter gotjawalensis]BAT57674.1 cystine-binding periplasmic protein precursor [Variibacter gotjawalensis]
MRWMKIGVLLAAITMAGDTMADDNAKKELAPNGTLRVGLVFAPSMSLFFVVKDANGQARGVTHDIGKALGASLGLPVEFVLFPNSGLATDATESGAVDVSFMPVDEERKKRIAFGTNYTLGESTYMATGASGAKTVEEVDRAGMRVIGIANTTTIRAATRTLKNTTIAPVTSVEDAVSALRDGKADAFALSRDSLPTYVKQIAGSRIVDGAFQQIGIAIAVKKGKEAALGLVTDFLEDAKKSGVVRKALDAAGYPDSPVAPAGSRS